MLPTLGKLHINTGIILMKEKCRVEANENPENKDANGLGKE
jgi:hypothetical protein